MEASLHLIPPHTPPLRKIGDVAPNWHGVPCTILGLRRDVTVDYDGEALEDAPWEYLLCRLNRDGEWEDSGWESEDTLNRNELARLASHSD